jgi:hypothetical protein
MHGYIQNTLPDSMTLDRDEKKLIVGLLALVEEHHGAILYLLRTGQYDGSAFALARALIDAAYRHTGSIATRSGDSERQRFTPMYDPQLCCKQEVKVTEWSAPMYAALIGVCDSWP